MIRSSGFTLLELMIAVAIFSVISTAAYKIFDSVSRAQQAGSAIWGKMDRLQGVQLVIEKDLFQMVDRPIRDASGESQPAVRLSPQQPLFLEFTRLGWRNPLQEPRSNLQRVGYELNEGKLIRHYWHTLDRPPGAESVQQTVLDDVRGVRVRFMDGSRRWTDSWPPVRESERHHPMMLGSQHGQMADKQKKKEQEMPLAVEMTVDHQQLGTLVVALPVSEYQPESRSKGVDSRQKRVAPGRF